MPSTGAGSRSQRAWVNRRRRAVAAGLLSFAVAAVAITSAVASAAPKHGVTRLQLEERQFSWLPKSKRAPLDRELQRGLEGPRASKTSPPPTNDQPVTPPVAGIISTQDAPFSPGLFHVSNLWTGEIGSQWWTVYAGQQGVDIPDGTGLAGVVVYQDPSDLSTGSPATDIGTFFVTNDVGSLSVVSVSDSTLTLADNSGASYAFSLSNDEFTALRSSATPRS